MARKSKKTETIEPEAVQPEVETTPETEIVDAEAVSVDPVEEVTASSTKEDGTVQAAEIDAEAGLASDAAAETPEASGPDEADVMPKPSDEPQDTSAVPPPDAVDAVSPQGAEAASDDTAEPDVPEPKASSADVPPSEDTSATKAPEPVTTAVPVHLPTVVEKRGPGFFPLVLGGLVAGAIGYAIPTFVMPPPAAEIDMSRVDALEARLADLQTAAPSAPAAAVDLSALEAGQAGLESAQADMSGRFDGLETRVAALEAAPAPVVVAPVPVPQPIEPAPAPEPVVAPEVTAALEALRGDVVDLNDRIGALPMPVPGLADRVAAVEQALDDLVAETANVETEAVDLAREAARNQLLLALESGLPFAEQLAVLGGDVPPALATNAQTGIATAQSLSADFPGFARAALAEARKVEPEDGNPVTAFLRRQTAARSLEPREGTDADAVLSRAEAALRAGDVSTALSETATLPPEAAAVLSDWTERANARVAAQNALQDYLKTE